MMGQVDAARLLIDVSDPQPFAAGVGLAEAAGEKGVGGRKAVKLQRKFGTLEIHRTHA